VFTYIESAKAKSHWWPYRVVYDYYYPHSQSLKSREARETRKVYAEPQLGMTCISLPPPKFIRQYLPMRINRGQRSIPYAIASYKQHWSRSTSRMEGGSPLSRRRDVSKTNLQKRSAKVASLSLPSLSPLIPKVYKYWKGVYSPKGRLQDRSCTPWHGTAMTL